MPIIIVKQPEQKYLLNLTAKQRESIVHATRLRTGVKTRLEVAPPNLRFVEFTSDDLKKMGEEIETSLNFAPPDDKKRLQAVLKKIDRLLTALKGKTERQQPTNRISNFSKVAVDD